MMKTKTIITSLLLAASSLAWANDHYSTRVTVTTYNAVASQCDSDPLTTANGTHIDNRKVRSGEQRIVAVSRDLLRYFPYGSTIYIQGHGYYQVCDTMNKRFTSRIDILQHPSQRNFKKTNILVRLHHKPSNR